YECHPTFPTRRSSDLIKAWDITVFTAFFPVLSVVAVMTSIASGMLVDRFGAWRIVPFILIPEGFGCIALGLLDPVWTIPIFFARSEEHTSELQSREKL